ncbi:uncharacterized protein LOC122672912 [Telopea speciosissima]|uniref:uncharacterized protein LOC122672912 n=1 Tax=Telopea speciosissima TaxID=54955 RepID=UPI001CC5C78D|nr:uncharacterized protein LOC122672912 [Telopea speciosissima]
MASLCLSVPIASNSRAVASSATSMSSVNYCVVSPMLGRCTLVSMPLMVSRRRVMSSHRNQVVCMAPEEEKMTRRSPLDFPIEWERPKPGRRPDIFPQFSPMKTPLPPPLPADPPEEDEEEEEKKEEEEEDPEKDDPDNPEKQ